MKKALVVNCSAQHYNLGAKKCANYLREKGWDVTEAAGDPQMFAYGYDLVCLSVIFSWHAPIAANIALRVKHLSEVWCGGPGMTALKKWWFKQTGLTATVGLDARFERQTGDYRMTFASRGCPVGCYFCIVPLIEGRNFTLYWDFTPAPVLCDNNLSALPTDFQEHIISRYLESGVVLKDANSGFEPATFDEDTFERWKPLIKVWRFAFDEKKEESAVEKMITLLKQKGVRARRIRVYTLAGNEPVRDCYQRAQKVLEWGAEPFCQFLRPLAYLGGKLPVKHDWTEQAGRDFVTFYNRFIFRKAEIWEYAPRSDGQATFAALRNPKCFN